MELADMRDLGSRGAIRVGSNPTFPTTTVLPRWKPVSQVRSKTPRLNINSTYTTTGTLCDMWLRGKDVNKKQSKVKIIKRIQQSITWLKEDSIKIN